MKKLVEYAPGSAVAAVGIGLFGYAIALLLAVFFSEQTLGARLNAWFTAAPAQNLGIPCAAISSFAIVAALLKAFPASSNENGQLQIKVFGLEFSGPSGPITLWLMCFIGFVFALKLLRV